MPKKNLQVGGQAVIEGVMMRSSDSYSVAVRRADGSIYVKIQPFISLIKKVKILSWPFLRGAVILIESMILGIKALSFSGEIAMEDEKNKDDKNNHKKSQDSAKKSAFSNLWLVVTVIFSFLIGLFIFFYIPLILTDLLGAKTGFMFNLVDGILRLVIFLVYLLVISLLKDIRRIFEYHGAEHKSIFAFENKKELIPSEAKLLSRFHPRCGTSFLLIVIVVSIFIFMFLGRPQDIGDRLLRLAFIPLIGGISYELIRLSGVGSIKKIWKPFIVPGLWLQRITTKEPDESQLEVAIVALKCALGLEISEHRNVVLEGNESFQAEGVPSKT